jgi:NAD(P)-dependent dehydrogenase (short-subunit alcohol dehydrogenase family)
MPSVLITGANRGIGLEFAKQYAHDGYRVFAAARNVSPALRTLAENNGRVSVHKLELTDPKSIRALADELQSEAIDVLINNAGWMGPAQQRLGSIDYDGLLETLRVNAIAPLQLAEAFVEHVARSDRRLMVALTSGMGSISDSSGGYYAYRASKAALNMSFHNLGLDLKHRGVIAIVINPGWVQTDMGGKQAPTKVDDSVAMMRQVFDGLTLDDTGSFKNYKGGDYAW